MHGACDLCKTRIYIIDTVLKKELTTNFNTAYILLQVIFVHIDKVSIPTLISRRTDQEIRNSKA